MSEPPPTPPTTPRQTWNPAWEVTCENCGQCYVFFLDAEFVAPCPACGWIQKVMYPAARAIRPVGFWSGMALWVGIILLFLGGVFFIPTMQAQSERLEPNHVGALSKHVFYWLIEGTLVILGGGSLLASWLAYRLHDPNSGSQDQRRARAQQVCLTRDVYQAMLVSPPPQEPFDSAQAPGIPFTLPAAAVTGSTTLAPAQPAPGIPAGTSPPVLMSSDYRTYGWLYVVLGPILFVGGILTYLDPSSPRIAIGAIIVGPIMFFRGLYYLRNS